MFLEACNYIASQYSHSIYVCVCVMCIIILCQLLGFVHIIGVHYCTHMTEVLWEVNNIACTSNVSYVHGNEVNAIM